MARNSDITSVVSPVEKQMLLSKNPSLVAEIVSNIHCITPPQTPFSKRKHILFVGGFDHVPNINAVTFLVGQIFPLVRQGIPDVCLYIVGSNPPKQVTSLQHRDIIVAGYVKDLLPYLEACKLFVSPLRYGAGVKGKITQSMSHGLPVVTTYIGAEGIHLVDGENALIADAPEEFAKKTVLLYTDEGLWQRLSENSVTHTEKHYSYATAAAKLGEVFRTLSDTSYRTVGDIGDGSQTASSTPPRAEIG